MLLSPPVEKQSTIQSTCQAAKGIALARPLTTSDTAVATSHPSDRIPTMPR